MTILTDNYFTEAEVCEVLGIKLVTMKSRRSRGDGFPPFVKIGRKILYPKEEFSKWIKNQVVQREISAPVMRRVK